MYYSPGNQKWLNYQTPLSGKQRKRNWAKANNSSSRRSHSGPHRHPFTQREAVSQTHRKYPTLFEDTSIFLSIYVIYFLVDSRVTCLWMDVLMTGYVQAWTQRFLCVALSPFLQPFSQSVSQIACVTESTAVCTHSGALRRLPLPAKINKYCMFQALKGYLDALWLILLQLVRGVTKFREALGDILSKWIKPLFMPAIHCTHLSFHGHYSFMQIKSWVMNFRCIRGILKTMP